MTTATETAPAATAWQIDPAHTEDRVSARHLMISNVKGRFSDVAGTVFYDPARKNSLDLRVTIPIATIDTRNGQRDTHLKSADFFDAEIHPEMVFVGKRIEGDITDTFKLIGDLPSAGTRTK